MARFDLVGYLSGKISRARLKGSEFTGLCPLHSDSSPSFSVNVDTGKWICRSASCGKRGGSIVSLIAQIERIPYKDAARIAQVRMPLYSGDDFEALVGRVQTTKRAPTYPVLPECTAALDSYPPYLVERGYPPESEVAQFWDLRVGTRSRDLYRGRFAGYLIMPVFAKDGTYLSFTARLMGNDKNRLRYDGPPEPVKNYLYGEWLLSDGHGPVYIVEGQFDAMRLWTFGEDVLGTFGTSYTHKQILRLRGLVGSRKIVVCYDPDAIDHSDDDLFGGSSDMQSSPMELVSTLRSMGDDCSLLDIGSAAKDVDLLSYDHWAAIKSATG